jgi:excisionase family DNA binding protein
MEEEIKQQLDRIERNSLLAAKRVLCLNDVILLTGLSKSHLYQLTSGKQIPHYKPTGKQVYFDREELEGWMKQNRVASNAEVEAIAQTYLTTGKMKGLVK